MWKVRENKLVRIQLSKQKKTPVKTKHILKSNVKNFTPINFRIKKFDVRINDRDFKVGDTLILREWDEKYERYTGQTAKRTIGFIERIFGVSDGLVILGFSS